MRRSRLPVLILVAALTLAGAVGGAAPAQAAGHDGYCTTDTGVTVVIDFQDLGGGVVIRCASSIPSGGTGVDALKAAGISYEGVRRWGDAFICRLYAKPSASQDLDVSSKPGYREQCIDTPPASAYWGYWHASNGGSWQYSSYGVKNRRATPGGFEGWSFSLNSSSSSSSPPPRVSPSRPAAPRPSASTSPSGGGSTPARTPRRTGGNSAGGGANGGNSGGGNSGGSNSSDSAGAAGSAGGSAQPPNGSATTPGADANSSGGTPTTSPTGGSTGTTTLPPSLAATEPPTSGADDLVVDSDQLASSQVDPSDSGSITTLVGVGLLTFVVVAGIGTAWRRRRE